MNKYLITGNKAECCGCLACIKKCPTKALKEQKDEEGFSYPELDEGKCIKCGLCKKVCSFEKNEANKAQSAYAFKHNSKEVRINSSSGGAFTAISDYLLNMGYKIYGVILDEEGKAIHIGSKSVDVRNKMRGSKYVQSDLKNTYCDIQEELKVGEKILFVGTPCQVNGLKLYLDKTYENLITIDFICHGVISPMIFQDYLQLVSNQSCIEKFSFRDKNMAEWGIHKSSIKCTDMSNIKYLPYYMKVFSRGFAFRPSCHNCKFSKVERVSDITLADFWGIENLNVDFKDAQGVSLILLNNQKYESMLMKCFDESDYIKYSIEEVVGYQIHLKTPAQPSLIRDKFWKYYRKHGGEKTLHLYASDTLYSKLRRKPLEFFRKGR